MSLWNTRDLAAPPNQTYETTLHVVNTIKLASICREAIGILNEQKVLHKEAAMLSRLLYRMKTKFRNDKGFKYMSKVNRGLLNYLSMNLARIYSLLEPSPPELGTRAVLAPSRQMIEWVLLRTQGFACLMCNMAQNCEDAAFYMKCRMKLGHVWEVALLSLAVVSRIWAICKYLALSACEWYEELRSFLDVLKPVGVPWLPQGYQLPENLKSWLNSPILDVDTVPKLKTHGRVQDKIFTLIDLEEENNNATEEEWNTKHTKDNPEIVTNLNIVTNKHKHLNTSLEDLGEPVEDISLTLLNSSKFSPQEEVLTSKVKKRKKKLSKECMEDPSLTLLNSSMFPPKEEVSTVKRKKRKKQPYKEPLILDGTQFHEETIVNSNIEANIPPAKKKKKNEVNVQNQFTDSKLKCIKCLRSSVDVKKFLRREEKLRELGSTECLTRSLDKLQWHMLSKALSDILKKLKSKEEGTEEYQHFMKKARKELKLRI